MKPRSLAALALLGIATGCTRNARQEAAPPQAAESADTARSYGSVARLDPALDSIVPSGARIERVATGFEWIEGPVWAREGFLLFAAIHHNRIMKWTPGQDTTELRRPSGYLGAAPYPGPEPGSNGMTLDGAGRLTVAGHAARNLYRLESIQPGAPATVLVDHYQGKRLNSPNDLAYRSDGSLYFTDPPYGLPTQGDADPLSELSFNGVYRLPAAASVPAGSSPEGREPQLLIRDLSKPNGLAFSPDEKYLYVAVSDPRNPVWMRYDVMPDGSVANGQVFCRASASEGRGSPDGLKVDREGYLYGSGPGGVWIISPEGKHIGTIRLPETASNVAWGDEDGKTLYITASTSVYRIRLSRAGVRP
jgi:gluconolactonase